jgi:fatty-acyl-CoA synthase
LEAFASRGSISKYAIPQKIQFLEHLAKTSVGKIDKKSLRETYAQLAAQGQPS